MSLLKKKNQPAPMATTAITAAIIQVKGPFVAAVEAAADAETAWVPVGVGVVLEGQAWLGWLFVRCKGEPHVPQNFAPAMIFEPHRGQKLIAIMSP